MCWCVIVQKIPVVALAELRSFKRNGFPQTTSSRSPLITLVFETLIATVEDIASVILVTSTDIARTPDLSECVRQSSSYGCL
ncbi:hypothetical protein TNCV_452901 [Trichonephila clavipes]|nr:hypothetical protein TNCV_452901 [Trichonephila clavipes]